MSLNFFQKLTTYSSLVLQLWIPEECKCDLSLLDSKGMIVEEHCCGRYCDMPPSRCACASLWLCCCCCSCSSVCSGCSFSIFWFTINFPLFVEYYTLTKLFNRYIPISYLFSTLFIGYTHRITSSIHQICTQFRDNLVVN